MLTYFPKAFTLIELVVAATILVVLTSIGFYSYTQNIADARDGVRKTDIAALSSQLTLYKKQRGAYPAPGDSFEIHNRGYHVASQGFMNQNVTLSTATKLPFDPELNIPYFYSTTTNRQEFQLSLSLENNDTPKAILDGDYKSVAKNVLPTIMLAISSSTPIEINADVSPGGENRDLFIFHNGYNNLPYDFNSGSPYSDDLGFTGALDNASESFWQNSDYRDCNEIFIAGKGINDTGDTDEYQILVNGALTGTGCTAP